MALRSSSNKFNPVADAAAWVSALATEGLYVRVVFGSVALVAVSTVAAPVAVSGIKQTVVFLRSLGVSKKRLDQERIDNYNGQFADKVSAEDRNKGYASLVDAYYDLATEFYEWGWGTSFHFSDLRKTESFKQAIKRHEYYLAGRLGVNKDAAILDCGCGIGGPARNIARFTGAHVTAVTINEFQVARGNTISRQEGIYGEDGGQVKLECADFMNLPYADASFDGVYAIEATCHAPDRQKVYSEILRVLKPGGVFATYEWGLTDKYDPNSARDRKIKADIILGDGLPDLINVNLCTKALSASGFNIQETRDCALDDFGPGGKPWYYPLVPTWNPLRWPGFQFNPILIKLTPVILQFFEFIGMVPRGTSKTQVMLQAGGIGCCQGGLTGVFTPMWLMVARKPLQ